MNHVLVNEYKPKVGIMAHSDGPLYFPFTIVISLNSSCLLEFFNKQNFWVQKEPCKFKIFVEAGSIYVFCDEAYEIYLHKIEDWDHDIISLLIEEIDHKINIIDADVLNWKYIKLIQQL